MIKIENLTKRYGEKMALKDVSFTVNPGEIVGFLGRNGAGKTTTMNIITGYLSMTSGEVSINGCDILRDPIGAKRQIGYLPEQPPLYTDMTVWDYLNFSAGLKKLPRKGLAAHLGEVCDVVRIGDMKKRMIRNLSKGYKQRVGLAQALVGNPQVLILDEPTVGLDPKQMIEIRNLIKNLGKKHTLILSSHILQEISFVCEKVVIINHGRIVAQDDLQHLVTSIGSQNALNLRVAAPEAQVTKLVRSLPGVVSAQALAPVEPGACELIVTQRPGEDVRRVLFAQLARANMPILVMRPMDATLEDIFLRLTEGRGELT